MGKLFPFQVDNSLDVKSFINICVPFNGVCVCVCVLKKICLNHHQDQIDTQWSSFSLLVLYLFVGRKGRRRFPWSSAVQGISTWSPGHM